MNADYCHVTLVLDNSGSMLGCWSETINSIRSFLAEQRKLPGKMTFSLFTFNTVIHKILDFVDVQDKSREDVLSGVIAGGWTAMWDASQFSMNSVGESLSNMPESDRPAKVLFVFLTDGDENASKFANRNQVRDMIEHQKTNYNWQFAFLGADFDASKDAGAVNVQVFNYNKMDTADVLTRGLSASVANYRTKGSVAYSVGDIK